jgi:hypothetical protein
MNDGYNSATFIEERRKMTFLTKKNVVFFKVGLLVVTIAVLIGPLPVLALPILPGNQHPHGAADVDWHHTGAPGGAIADDPNTHLHQHWNFRALDVNHGSGSFFANAAWDNNGTTTTYHDRTLGDATFGHGFINDRVLYWFNPEFANDDARLKARVNEVFTEWETLVAAVERPDRVLGFNFTQHPEATAPAGEPFIEVRFTDLADNTAGSWDNTRVENFETHRLQFNTEDFFFHAGVEHPLNSGLLDFITVARHEIGHVIGLDHTVTGAVTAGSLMAKELPELGVRVAIDAGSIQGALALYTQPVPKPSPEPSTFLLLLLGLGLGALAFLRRKSAKMANR